MEENFVVVSLEDKKSKEVAKILTNDTARRILDELSKKRKSMSELAAKLKLPISTIQYNMDALKQAGFVKDTAYRYSEKGKRILYYEPARKIVILAPKEEEQNILNKLKLFLIPAGLAIVSLGSWMLGSGRVASVGYAAEAAAAPLAAEAAADVAVPMCRDAVPQIISVPEGFIFLSGLFAGLAILTLGMLIWRWKYGKK